MMNYYTIESPKVYSVLSLEEFKKINYKLDTETVEYKFFDSLLVRYPNSEYIRAMKMYYSIYERMEDVDVNEDFALLVNSTFAKNASTFIYFVKGMRHQEAGEDSLAYAMFDKSIETDLLNINVWAHLEKIRLFLNTNYHFDLAHIKDLINKYPNFNTFKLQSAEMYHLLGQCDEAYEILMTIQSEMKGHVYYHICLGRVYFGLNQIDESINAFKASMSIRILSEALTEMGFVYQAAMEDLITAQMLHEQAIEMDSTNWQAYKNLAYLHVDKDIDRAYDVVLIGVQHCKNISSLWNLLMSIEITRGSINSAESHFKNLSLYCKRDFYFYLSEIHLNCVKGNFGEAKRSFQDFLKNFPDEESALLEFLNAFEANCIK